MDEFIKLIMSVISTILTLLFGGFDLAIQLLLLSIVIDFVSGMIRSGVQHKLNSDIGFHGVLKKVGILLLVTVGTIMDSITVGNGLLRLLVIYYFMANEFLSVIENLGELGIPIPKNLKSAIMKLQEDNTEDEDAKRH